MWVLSALLVALLIGAALSLLTIARMADSRSLTLVPIRTPLLLSAFSLTAAGLVFLDAPATVRAPVTLGFILLCPGFSVVRLAGVTSLLAQVALAIALSLALALLIAGTLLFAGIWSPDASFGLLLAIATGGNLAEVLLALRRLDNRRA